MSQNRSRGSRMDETGRSPEAVEHDIERDWGPDAPGVRQDEQLRNAERLPRRGNEEDKPYSDALGD